MKKYIHIWWLFVLQASQTALLSRFGASLFIIGKLIRFFSFLLLLILLSNKITAIAGYTIWQIALFFITFSLIDSIPQFIFREVYRFRNYVVNGDFDYILIKPLSPLFRSLFGGSDILDIPTLLLYVIGIIFCIVHITYTTQGLILYISLIINSLLIATAFHIFILSLGIITTEVDNAMMFYRDLTVMGRFPIDIYQEPIRSILTFVIPVGIMMTVPVKALIGLYSGLLVLIAYAVGISIFCLSLLLWRYALRLYTSASS